MKTAKNVLFNLVLIGVTFVLLMTLIASFKGCERFEEDPPIGISERRITIQKINTREIRQISPIQ